MQGVDGLLWLRADLDPPLGPCCCSVVVVVFFFFFLALPKVLELVDPADDELTS